MVSVVICTRNRAGLLEKAVRSLLPELDEESELLIVDNGSTDETPELCVRLARENSLIRIFRELTLGISVTRNLALREARGTWVIFMDDDALVEPGWLPAYKTFFKRPEAEKAGSAGGPVLPLYEVPAPNWLPEATPPPQAPGGIWRCRPGENVTGCNFAVRRDLALAAGAFNPALGHCGAKPGAYDEIELIERLVRAGHEVWWVNDARVQHLVAAGRLRLKWQLSCAYQVGVCSAIRKLNQKKRKTDRIGFALLRMSIAPFHCVLYLLMAAAYLLQRNRRKAVRSLFRASSTAGFACELARRLF